MRLLNDIYAKLQQIDSNTIRIIGAGVVLKGPMAEWHKPHEAIHVTVGSIPEST